MLFICSLYAYMLFICSPRSVYALYMLFICLYALCISSLYALYIRSVYALYMLFISLLFIYALHMLFICSLYAHRICSLYAHRSLYALYMLTVSFWTVSFCSFVPVKQVNLGFTWLGGGFFKFQLVSVSEHLSHTWKRMRTCLCRCLWDLWELKSASALGVREFSRQVPCNRSNSN